MGCHVLGNSAATALVNGQVDAATIGAMGLSL